MVTSISKCFSGKEEAPPTDQRNSRASALRAVLETSACLAALSQVTGTDAALATDMPEQVPDQSSDESPRVIAATAAPPVPSEPVAPERSLTAAFSPAQGESVTADPEPAPSTVTAPDARPGQIAPPELVPLSAANPSHAASSDAPATPVTAAPAVSAPPSTQARDLLPQPEPFSAQPRFSPSPGSPTPPPIAPLSSAGTFSSPLPAQDETPAAVAASGPSSGGASPETAAPPTAQRPVNEYLTAPTPIAPDVLSPLVTTIPLNGEPIDFERQGAVTTGLGFGDDRTTNLIFRGSYQVNRALETNTTADNVTTLSQRQTLFQGRDVLRERRLEISQRDPVTLLGQTVQFSLTADCQEIPDATCTYTPGLITDRDTINPETLLPTQFEQPSNFGDVVTPASLAAIQAPGFQQGANGQQIGVDFYLPNIASLPGNTASTTGEIIREETLDTIPAINLTEINQTVRSNATTAGLGRTIRGPAVVFDEDQSIANVILAAIAGVLPEVEPHVTGTKAAADPNINRGLFFAANNTRIPADSLTLYQAGVGYAATPAADTGLDELPPATFNTLWLGLSPVTDRSFEAASFFDPTGDQQVTLFAGGEGGRVEAPELLSLVNGELFSAETLTNSYTQNYVTLFEQEASRVSTFRQTDRIRYVPHLSFSGNITGPANVFRYYAGTLTGDTVQAYGGLDYQGQIADGWSYRAGAIGFINPTYDRYSNLSGGVSKRFDLGADRRVTLGSSFNWALDQDTQVGDIEQVGRGSDVTVQARLDTGRFGVGVSQLIGDVLPNSQESRTVFDTSMKLGEDLRVAGFWAPFDNAASAPQFGILADVGLHVGDVNPHLIFSWQNTRYDYGEDLVGNDLTTTGNTFEVLLRLDW